MNSNITTIKIYRTTNNKLAMLKELTSISRQALVDQAMDAFIRKLKSTGALEVDMSTSRRKKK